MVVTSEYQTYIGGRGGTSDILYLNTYNAREIVVNLLKTDAGAVGQIFARNPFVKQYVYDQQIKHNDTPNLYYMFRAADISNGTVAHEEMTGSAITVTNNRIIAAGPGSARFANSFGFLLSSGAVTDATSGRWPLKFAEQNAQPWTWEAWVNRGNNSAAAEMYFETNGAATSWISIQMNTNGTIVVARTNGGGNWTSPVGSPVGLSAWHHVMVVYSAAGATNQLFLDGVSAGAAVASVRGGPYDYTAPSVQLNRFINSQVSIAQVAAYQNVLMVQDDAARHYQDLTGDIYPGNFSGSTASIGQNTPASVTFTNLQEPKAWDATTGTIVAPLTPLVAVQTTAGVFLAEVITYLYEGTD